MLKLKITTAHNKKNMIGDTDKESMTTVQYPHYYTFNVIIWWIRDI